MKRSHAGAALSIAIHAVVALVCALRWPDPREPIIAAPPATQPAPIEIIEVAFVEPEQVQRAASAPGVERAASRPPRGGRVTSRGATGEAAPPAGETAAVHATPSEPSNVVVPALPSVRESADHLTGAIAPAPSPGDKALRPDTTFDIHVARDGTAHILDRRNLQLGAGNPETRREIAEDERWLEEHHEQSNAIDMKVGPVGATVATFDATDWAMRAAGQDPYAAAKLKALDATRDARAELGAQHRDQELVRIPALVRAQLAEIKHLPPGHRKAALVELWRDCDGSASGEVARATIKAYPGFTDDERAALTP